MWLMDIYDWIWWIMVTVREETEVTEQYINVLEAKSKSVFGLELF